MNFRKGNTNDVQKLTQLGVQSWMQYKDALTVNFWNELYQTISNLDTYANLLSNSECVVCENESFDIIGMAFLVSKGNPNAIYEESWCHLRFVSVHPEYAGKGIGAKLTDMCIDIALQNKEQIMALHTSEIMNAARHIYEKIGFKKVKEIAPRLGVRYWIYTLDLNEYR